MSTISPKWIPESFYPFFEKAVSCTSQMAKTVHRIISASSRILDATTKPFAKNAVAFATRLRGDSYLFHCLKKAREYTDQVLEKLPEEEDMEDNLTMQIFMPLILNANRAGATNGVQRWTNLTFSTAVICGMGLLDLFGPITQAFMITGLFFSTLKVDLEQNRDENRIELAYLQLRKYCPELCKTLASQLSQSKEMTDWVLLIFLKHNPYLLGLCLDLEVERPEAIQQLKEYGKELMDRTSF